MSAIEMKEYFSNLKETLEKMRRVNSGRNIFKGGNNLPDDPRKRCIFKRGEES